MSCFCVRLFVSIIRGVIPMKLKKRLMRHRHLWFSVWNQAPYRSLADEPVEPPMKISGR
jgi:hypothetical protein